MNAGESGSRARLREAMRRFASHTEEERLRLFRLHLQLTVSRVSPLAVDLLAYAGTSLAEASAGLVPPPTWPRALLKAHDDGFDADPWSGGRRSVTVNGSSLRRAIRLAMLNPPRRPIGTVGNDLSLMAVGDRIEVTAALAGCRLQTYGGMASLLLAQTLPETIVAAAPGRPIDALIAHPVFDGRGYPVYDVRDGHGPGHAVTFRTGMLPWRMPWGDELAVELGRRT